MHIVYIREMHCLSLLYESKMVINNFEIKVEVQKGALRFKKRNNNRCANFLYYGNIPQ